MGNKTEQMSLRQIAKTLGVSHTLLVLWRQGKRSLSPDLERRYNALAGESGYTEVVTTQVVTKRPVVTAPPRRTPHGPVAQSGQSIGLLIRVSWVRIPAGPPPHQQHGLGIQR